MQVVPPSPAALPPPLARAPGDETLDYAGRAVQFLCSVPLDAAAGQGLSPALLDGYAGCVLADLSKLALPRAV